MKIFRLILFCAAFFFLKESAIAQPEGSFKNISFKNENLFRDSTEKIDSARVKNRKFWAEFWETYKEHYAPAISLGAGMHTEMMSGDKVRTFEKGAAWSAVVNFPFDRGHYFNWELAYQVLYGRDTSQNTVATDIFTFGGMRFYFTDRHALLRPFVSWGIAGASYYIIPLKINIAAGLDYRITGQWSTQISLGDVYSYSSENVTKGRYTSYAGFLGVRYQL